jgi:1-acyl-sn-glycerol-3-phosphate acyltransferase
MIHTVFAILSSIVATAFFSCLAIFVSLWNRDGDYSHVVGRIWAKTILLLSRVTVSVQGLHHLDAGATYIYMVNHQSMFDILVLQGYVSVQFRWLAKRELFQIPVFGPSMTRAGYISIDRSNRRMAHKSLLEAAQKIAQGVSVVIFPEGSRSRDGEIMPFKPGGFHLAVRAGQPIVPVAICGTHDVMPKGSLRISPGRVTVSINPPIETASYAKGDKSLLMETVRSVMKQDFERVRATVSENQRVLRNPTTQPH